MKNIIIITSNEIRHNYLKTIFSNSSDINVLRTYCEGQEDSFQLERKVFKPGAALIENHFNARHNTEYDFFSDIIECSTDHSKTKFINKGEINEPSIIDEIIKLNPDLIITYGCSIIKPKLIEVMKDKIINVHLGVSPYYLGAGTNFHSLVNGDFQCFGYTFMYMDEGIDTGEIIHQARGTIEPFDNPHQIGNRLIKDMVKDFVILIQNFNLIVSKQPLTKILGKTYKKKDATDELTSKLYQSFEDGSVLEYLQKKSSLEKEFPIIEQEFLRDVK